MDGRTNARAAIGNHLNVTGYGISLSETQSGGVIRTCALSTKKKKSKFLIQNYRSVRTDFLFCCYSNQNFWMVEKINSVI